MIIKYDNNNINKLCNDSKTATRKLGKEVAIKLGMTLEFINASETLRDVKNTPMFRLHDLKHDRKGQFAIDLGKKLGYRLILIPLKNDEEQWDSSDINEIYNSTNIILLLEVTNHYE